MSATNLADQEIERLRAEVERLEKGAQQYELALSSAERQLADLAEVVGQAYSLRCVNFAGGETVQGLKAHALVEAMLTTIHERDIAERKLEEAREALSPERVESYIAGLPWRNPDPDIITMISGNVRAFANHIRAALGEGEGKGG